MSAKRREIYRRIITALKSVEVEVHAIRETTGAIASLCEGEIKFSLHLEILVAFTGDESDLERCPL